MQGLWRIVLLALLAQAFALVMTGCEHDVNIRRGNIDDTQVGRFQLVQLGTMRRDQLLLDTATGNIWRTVCYYQGKSKDIDCDVSAWRQEDIVGINTTNENINELIDFLKKQKK